MFSKRFYLNINLCALLLMAINNQANAALMNALEEQDFREYVKQVIAPNLQRDFESAGTNCANAQADKLNIDKSASAYVSGKNAENFCIEAISKGFPIATNIIYVSQCRSQVVNLASNEYKAASQRVNACFAQSRYEEAQIKKQEEDEYNSKIKKAASIAHAQIEKEQQDFSSNISKYKSQNPSDYSNLVACYFQYNSNTAMELASDLARIAANSSPTIFSNAMNSGGFAKYCQIAYGTPSKDNISNAIGIAKGENSTYWCVNKGNAALCFTSSNSK